MKRPILVITLGFIIGIILGLYLNIAPFIFLAFTLISIFFKIINYKSNNNCIRILNIFIKNNIIIAFFVSALIASLYLGLCNKCFGTIYKEFN